MMGRTISASAAASMFHKQQETRNAGRRYDPAARHLSPAMALEGEDLDDPPPINQHVPNWQVLRENVVSRITKFPGLNLAWPSL